MTKVTYTGTQSMVRHRGAKFRAIPYEFVKGVPVDIEDADDLAMFAQMASANPETWKVEPSVAKKVIEKMTGQMARKKE